VIESFKEVLGRHGLRLVRERIETVQVNLGNLCNQSCSHCHVEGSPQGKKVMSQATAREVVGLVERLGVERVELTGGAPELNPNFRWLVERLRGLGAAVVDRCNLTVLTEPGQEDLVGFLRRHEVEVVCSLPCYTEANVDKQRGPGAFARSLAALKRLNAAGYGKGGPRLNLVYNPLGAFLPPRQETLAADYRRQLAAHGISFDRLFTLANSPIGRFGAALRREGALEAYLDLLRASFNPATVGALMCRTLVSVDWEGRLFDCDFNLALGLGARGHASEADQESLLGDIAVTDHCFACTAGAGSSCRGALQAA
jgi:radical SAM/Cys-rich protein